MMAAIQMALTLTFLDSQAKLMKEVNLLLSAMMLLMISPLVLGKIELYQSEV